MTTLIPILIVGALGVARRRRGRRDRRGARLAGRHRRPAPTARRSTSRRRDARSSSGWPSAGLVVGLVCLVWRSWDAILVGHAPWSNLHEFSLAFAAALLAAYLFLARAYPIAGLAPLVAILAAGLLVFALQFDDRVDPLVPALQQPILLTVHVGTAALAYAVAGSPSSPRSPSSRRRATGDRIGGLPPAAVCRAVGHRRGPDRVPDPDRRDRPRLGLGEPRVAQLLEQRPEGARGGGHLARLRRVPPVASRRDRWQRLAPWLIVLGFAGVLFTYVGAGLFLVGEHSYGQP